MASELKRGVVRIVSNYFNLFATVILGLLLVRFLLGSLGNEAFGLITLLVSGAAIPGLMRQVTSQTMIRELGAAYHAGDQHEFRTMMSSAYAVAAGCTVVALLGFAVLFAVVPLLEIPKQLHLAARVVVVAKAAECAFIVLWSPAFNMMLVTERMATRNIYWTIFRASETGTAAWLVIGGVHDAAQGIMFYGIVSAALIILFRTIATLHIALAVKGLWPDPRLIRRSAIRTLLTIGGWNVAVMMAMNLHIKIGQIIVNLAFGLVANTIMGIAIQLASYVRRLASGMTVGIDAVSARVSTRSGDTSVAELIRHTTKLNAFAAFPAGILLFTLAEPLASIWVRSKLSDAIVRGTTLTVDEQLALAADVIRVLVWGITARAISEGWSNILYGSGHIRAYAPLVILGGVCNPPLAILLIWLLPDHPGAYGIEFFGTAISFSFIFTLFHFVFLPRIASRTLGIPYANMYKPMRRPLLASLLCAPIPIAASFIITTWTLPVVLLVGALFGTAYAICTLTIVLNRVERQRLVGIIRRRLGRGRTAPAAQRPDPRDDAGSTSVTTTPE